METGLPRHIPNNPYKYTAVEIAKRTVALKAMVRDYPTVPIMWIELLYDTVGRLPNDEIERIIENKEWERPSKYKALGGTYFGCTVDDK